MHKKIFFLILCSFFISHAALADQHDARPLTQDELKIFLPLICDGAHKNEKPKKTYDYTCGHIIGYADLASSNRSLNISVDSIIYGGITALGADEAYLSYSADFESHATLFGGGILFKRENNVWHLVNWYPAEFRSGCLVLPANGPLEVLCSEWDGHPDMTTEGIHIKYVDPSKQDQVPTYHLSQEIVVLRDNNFESCSEPQAKSSIVDPCSILEKGKEVLMEMGEATDADTKLGLTRSTEPGVFAEALVEYATPDDLEKACKAKCFGGVKRTVGKIKFIVQGKKIEVVTPYPLQLYKEKPFNPNN